MIERGEDFRFALEAREPLGVSHHRCRQHLDGDATFQIGVGRPIHLPHTAHADLGGDFIRAEARAGDDRHLREILRDYS
jgi:hypothetical protein